MYVSDYLENLLIGSKDIRALVRKKCKMILSEMEPALKSKLLPIANYIGGKCMGYPAIWFLSEALNLSNEELKKHFRKTNGSLLISLSTSIADDLLDKNENMREEHLMFFYMLIIKSWLSNDLTKEKTEFIYKNIFDAMDIFIGEDSISEMKKNNYIPFENFRDVAFNSGKKIANFHKMIAFEWIEDINMPRYVKDILINQISEFGHFCAFLDDFLDIESDILNGDFATVPIYYLFNLFPETADLIRNKEIGNILCYLSDKKYLDALIGHGTNKVKSIATEFEKCPEINTAIINKFEKLYKKLPDEMEEVRLNIHKEWVKLYYTRSEKFVMEES